MPRRMSFVLILVAAVMAMAPSAYGAWYLEVADFRTVATFDENVSQANAIDREAEGNARTLAQFTADVATAYAADLGGVCTWGDADGYKNNAGPLIQGLGTGASGRGYNFVENPGGGVDGGCYTGETPRFLYGTSQTKSIYCSPSRALEIWKQGYGGLYTAVSGPSYYNTTGTPDGPLTPYAEGAVMTPDTNYAPGSNKGDTITFTGPNATESVKELGFVLLSSNADQAIQVWVTYADTTTSPVRTINVAAGTTVDDVFVHFAATTSAITSMTWLSDQGRPPVGDLGFIVGAVTPEPTWHPGDANKDGAVDLQDFGLLKENFGIAIGGGAAWEQGDFNGDGGIDLQDFGILKDHFGHTTGTVPVTAVPEPATMSLLALAGVGLLRRRAR